MSAPDRETVRAAMRWSLRGYQMEPKGDDGSPHCIAPQSWPDFKHDCEVMGCTWFQNPAMTAATNLAANARDVARKLRDEADRLRFQGYISQSAELLSYADQLDPQPKETT